MARQALKAQSKPPIKQSYYSNEVADLILERLSQGEPLSDICQDPGMPHEATFRNWVRDDRGEDEESGRQGLLTLYARARDIGYDCIAESLLTITNGDLTGPDGWVDNGRVQQMRLHCDNRKWLLAKVSPKKYGDKVTQEITGSDGSQLVTRIELIPVEPMRRQGPEIEADADTTMTRNQKLIK